MIEITKLNELISLVDDCLKIIEKLISVTSATDER
jgi:hypothetical protein